MANRDGREALRGAEVETFDLIAKVFTSAEWSKLLKAPLECAVGQGNRSLVQKLVRAGAEIGTALHAAVRGGHGDIVDDFLDSGAPLTDRDKAGRSLLHRAVQEGTTEMVERLLLKGADVEAMDHAQHTPLLFAVSGGHVGATLALLAAGADVTVQESGSDRSAVHTAAKEGHTDILRAMIEHGANVHARDNTKSTPLHRAAENNQVQPVDVLVEAGASVEALDEDGDTPLHMAALGSNADAALALLRHGADVDARNNVKRTPLYYAITDFEEDSGGLELVDLLLRSGADETIVDKDGISPMDEVESWFGGGFDEPLFEADRPVYRLMVNAPANRAWRRRGYLVLCRAHPDRMELERETRSGRVGVIRKASNGGRLARKEASGDHGTEGGGALAGENAGGDWADIVASVLRLQEEGIFRIITGYL